MDLSSSLPPLLEILDTMLVLVLRAETLPVGGPHGELILTKLTPERASDTLIQHSQDRKDEIDYRNDIT